MSKYFFIAFLIVIIGSVISNAYKTTQIREESVLIRPRRDTSEEQPLETNANGKDAADGTNQGLLASYWNSFLKRARLPRPSWNITNPLSNLFNPYVVEVDYPPENSKPQQLNGKPHLILLDPETQQYYKVQPVPS
ncbi:uncharacterized protein LOC129940422 [Eupeodes corollae]|uniref:uncharacterized protein LOC129940422 n=1 Tax=Eupeodes corollae TaxID=290404 RepID=UPI0024912702|nr:uncharacterized protein LOC129940422 [Eupeodes corollae]